MTLPLRQIETQFLDGMMPQRVADYHNIPTMKARLIWWLLFRSPVPTHRGWARYGVFAGPVSLAVTRRPHGAYLYLYDEADQMVASAPSLADLRERARCVGIKWIAPTAIRRELRSMAARNRREAQDAIHGAGSSSEMYRRLISINQGLAVDQVLINRALTTA